MKRRHKYALDALVPILKGISETVENVREECEVGTGDIIRTTDIIIGIKDAISAIEILTQHADGYDPSDS